ncbi:MAG: hypothetical protein ACAI44_11695 [Candidatus Sericytochromatia bacterium]
MEIVQRLRELSPEEAEARAFRALLQKNLNHPNPLQRLALARDERTPPPILGRLIQDAHPSVRLAAAENPGIGPEQLRACLDSESALPVLVAIARSPQLDSELRAHLLTAARPIRMALATNPGLEPEQMAQLAADPDPLILVGLLHNPALSPELLDRCLQHAQAKIRLLAVSHPQASQELLLRGSGDADEKVRNKAAQRLAFCQ